MLNGLDLFSGIGGISYALREWIKPVAYCEIDPYCQSVLLQRMQEKDLPKAPIWDDIRTLSINNSSRESGVDIIYGGFPCQDISVAGNGKGLEGERSGLFFEIMRLAKETKPKFIFLENVPAITSRGGLQVIKAITEMGYDCRWCVISAASVGASHKRDRWFLLAHTNNDGSSTAKNWGSVGERTLSGKRSQEQEEGFGKIERASSLSPNVANTKGQRSQQRGQPLREKEKQSMPQRKIEYVSWSEEPENKLELVRVANGISHRVDRIKALGNSVVPAQAKEAFKILIGLA